MEQEPSKKIIYIGITALALLIIGGIFWYWQKSKVIEVTRVDEITKEEAPEHLKELEQQIEETKSELEKLERLDPEERRIREEQRETLSALEVTKDVVIEGVEVSIVGERKEITNHKEGYRISVSQKLVMARSIASNWIELHDPKTMCEDPSCDPVILIAVAESNPSELSIAEWLAQEEKNAGEEIYSPREELPIGGVAAFRVTESLPPLFEGFSYYFGKGKKIYSLRISGTNESMYREYIETFLFLP